MYLSSLICTPLALCMLLSCTGQQVVVKINTDSVLNDISDHPVGINLDYLTDDDKYLQPQRPLVEALRAMGVKYLRYPGGNKSDFYFFSRPPYEKAEPTLARTGEHATGGRGEMLKDDYTAFRYDVLDFDEFIHICRQVGAEPVVVVAADEYLVKYPPGSTWSSREQLLQHAVEWVKYANIKKRYQVKYWMIGNESWHKENENSSAQIYAQDVVDFSRAMKAIDPSILIIPNGNNKEWWKTVLTIAADHIDALCVSNYPLSDCDKVSTDLLGSVSAAEAAIRQHAPPESRDSLRIIVAEYGPYSWCPGGEHTMLNTMENALVNLDITFRQLQHPSILFSCFWNTRWVNDGGGKWAGFNALDKNGQFTANGYSLMIAGKFLGDQMLLTTSSSDRLKAYSSLDSRQHRLYLYLINTSNELLAVRDQVSGNETKSVQRAWELSGAGSQDKQPVWRAIDGLTPRQELHIPPQSIWVIQYAL